MWLPDESLSCRGGERPSQQMMINNKVVVDWEGIPVILLDHLPETVGQGVRGSDVETWRRLNNNIEWRDILARMPVIKNTDANAKHPYKPVMKQRDLRQEAKRYREWNALRDWEAPDSDANERINTNLDTFRTEGQRGFNMGPSRELTVE